MSNSIHSLMFTSLTMGLCLHKAQISRIDIRRPMRMMPPRWMSRQDNLRSFQVWRQGSAGLLNGNGQRPAADHAAGGGGGRHVVLAVWDPAGQRRLAEREWHAARRRRRRQLEIIQVPNLSIWDPIRSVSSIEYEQKSVRAKVNRTFFQIHMLHENLKK